MEEESYKESCDKAFERGELTQEQMDELFPPALPSDPELPW